MALVFVYLCLLNSKLNTNGNYIRFAGSGSYYAMYCKKNNRVNVNIYLQITPSVTGYSIITTLPEDARPKTGFYSVYFDDLSLKTLVLRINSSGTIEAYFLESDKKHHVLCNLSFDI